MAYLRHLSISFLLLLLSFITVHSIYLPRDAPHDFYEGDIVMVEVNKLASTKTNLTYPFYSIPYCRPQKTVNIVENFGEIISGDDMQSSLYEFHMRSSTRCNIVCRITLNEETAKEFKEKIDDEYQAEMTLDGLPLVAPETRTDDESLQLGYFVGRKERFTNTEDDKYFINNHLSFIVKYHKNVESSAARIVGFEAKAFSINHQYNHQWSDASRLTTCDPHGIHEDMVPPQEVDDNEDIIFTYDVEFQESDVTWESIWDTHLPMVDHNQSHWFPIVNTLMDVLLVFGMVAAAMFGTYYRSICK